MTESPPATAQLFLADGTATGLLVAQKLGATAQVFAFSRTDYPRARQRPEFSGTGAYVLLGTTEDGSSESIYVGQTDDIRSRLDQHSREKDFWTRANVLVTTDQHLNRAHVLSLESTLIRLADESKRVQLENGPRPKLPPLSETDAAYVETCLRDFLLLLPLVRTTAFTPLFEPGQNTNSTTERPPVLVLRYADLTARGSETPDGFVVFKDSSARGDTKPSSSAWILDLRDRLLREKILVEVEGGHLSFTQDFRFDSPSAAAGVVGGGNANGRTAWKDELGRTLRELQDIAISDD